jgi:hypothetical protein
MATTYVAFDTSSGQILTVHHGAANASEVEESVQNDANITADDIAVIAVPYDAIEQGKQYRVDVDRNTLVETTAGQGVGFAFGEGGQPS